MKVNKVTQDMIHPQLRSIANDTMVRFNGFLSKRPWGVPIKQYLNSRQRPKTQTLDDIQYEEIYIPSTHDDHTIRTCIYKPAKITGKIPVMLYLHGGGYCIGFPESRSHFFESYIKRRPCIVIAPAYRLSVRHPFPAGFNDGYDTLLWIQKNMQTLGGNGKIIVAGHSAGGGMTVGVTLKARDTGDAKIAFQMAIYPMIDHHQNTESSQLDAPIWGFHTNRVAWDYYLSDLRKQGLAISPYAAPVMNKDHTNTPPTITMVGDIDPFYDETMNYVNALKKQKIPVAFKTYEGAFHSFDSFPSDVGRDAVAWQIDAYQKFYDKYAK